MSETTEHDAFLVELQEMLAKAAPAGKKVEAAHELAEAKPAAEQPSQAAVAQANPIPATQAAPLSQPVVSSVPSPEPMPPAAARTVDHEPVKLEGSDALDGVLVFNEGDEPIQKDVVRVPGKQKTAAAVKMKLVASVMVLLAAGYLMIPSDLVPQEAAQAPAETPVLAGEQTEVAQEFTPPGDASHAAAASPAGEPVSVGIDLSARGESPQSQDDLVTEMARDVQVIPEAEQSCAAGALSNSERRVCSTAGHVRFFACTQGTGRIWDVRVAGCEVI